MILEARSSDCFSWTFVLKLNERPTGKFEARWFSENLDVQLTQRRHLEFRKIGWLGSQFELVDLGDEQILAHGDRAGMFTSAWDLTLSVGHGQLSQAGWFDTAYEFTNEGDVIARVDRLGWCERGFTVD